MGCATSKQKVCRNCKGPYSPVRRSYSMHVHHPPQKTGDSYHVVALTSSTLGSLKLDPLIRSPIVEEKDDDQGTDRNRSRSVAEDDDKAVFGDGEIDRKISVKEEFAMGMIEAKTWSTMINEKIPKITPKTPVRTPPGEPETINAWEMMEGLEDSSPLRANHFRSFSFHVRSDSNLPPIDDQPTPRVKDDADASPKQAWSDLADSDSNSNSNSNDTSIVPEFDPEVIATFRKALEDLPPANPFCLRPIEDAEHTKDANMVQDDNDMKIVQKHTKDVNMVQDDNDMKIVHRGTEKLIVYFTSLRGVRKTYEDCCHVRVILKGLGVKIDERDVSMHSGFKEELKELLGDGSVGMGLPRIFLGKKCVGGAEEIRRMNEEGTLEKLVERCELVDDGGGGIGHVGSVCEACGDIRFVPCETCSGSCKIYYDGEYDVEEEDESDGSDHEFGFHRCPDCNENGLTRCPICCD